MERWLPECPSENLKFMGIHSRGDLWTLSHSEMAAVMLWPQLPQRWLCFPHSALGPILDVCHSEQLLRIVWFSYHPFWLKNYPACNIEWTSHRCSVRWESASWLSWLFPCTFTTVFTSHVMLHFTENFLTSEYCGGVWSDKWKTQTLRERVELQSFKSPARVVKTMGKFPSLKWK